jgi:glycine oxidase
MPEQSDVLILGGGVIGLTTAYFLSQADVRVTIVDKGQFGQESSWAGAGIITPAPPLEQATHPLDQLAAISAGLHPQISQHLFDSTGISNEYTCPGGWEIFDSHELPPVDLWRQQRIVFEEADAKLIAQREPSLKPAADQRVFFMPAMAQLRNPRHIKALLAWCQRPGIRLIPNCRVEGFERAEQRLLSVQTTQGKLSAGQYLLTAGAWSEGLLQQVGWRPGIKPIRGQIALLQALPIVLTRVVEVGKRYLVPRLDGHVLIGSTEEDIGFEKQTTAEAIRGLLDFGLSLVPELASAPVERCWGGLRPGSPDGLPFLGRVPGLDNLFVAAGHYRAGIQLSAATGLLMRQLLLGQPTPIPLDAFRLDRGRSRV